MRAPRLIALFAGILSFYSLTAQTNRPKIKYGDVSEKDFEPKVYSVDSSADAVYIYDVGESRYRENNNASFDVVFKRHARIRLLNKNSFDLATIEIQLYKYGTSSEEKLSDLDAATYNIENGKVVATKVDKGSLFKDKGENYTTVKFTFPNLKEGSIIEFNYEVSSPSPFYIEGWAFQGGYPRLWSEYTVSIPEFYDFVLTNQGYLPFVVDTVSMIQQSFYIADTRGAEASRKESLKGNLLNHTWAVQNVPALKREEYTTTITNHISKIEFQLYALRYPEQTGSALHAELA
jgi:hypothetical protein